MFIPKKETRYVLMESKTVDEGILQGIKLCFGGSKFSTNLQTKEEGCCTKQTKITASSINSSKPQQYGIDHFWMRGDINILCQPQENNV